MVDKGFLIEDLLVTKQCKLVIPNFLARKGQFSKSENELNAKIAKLSTVCCILSNFQGPLIKN